MPHETPPLFINYRNNNADNWAATLLYEGLAARFGSDAVFLASQSIPAGANFSKSIYDAIAHARAVLVIMGDNWAASLRCGRHPWVVKELQAAQERSFPDVRIIPVLLGRAQRLRREDVPVGINDRLCDTVGFSFATRTYRSDTMYIARVLGGLIPGLG